jgi:hypothetical protein
LLTLYTYFIKHSSACYAGLKAHTPRVSESYESNRFKRLELADFIFANYPKELDAFKASQLQESQAQSYSTRYSPAQIHHAKK